MSENRNKKSKDATDPYNLDKIGDFLYEKFSVMSGTECTGLIRAEPKTKAERENYKDIYDTTLG